MFFTYLDKSILASVFPSNRLRICCRRRFSIKSVCIKWKGRLHCNKKLAERGKFVSLSSHILVLIVQMATLDTESLLIVLFNLFAFIPSLKKAIRLRLPSIRIGTQSLVALLLSYIILLTSKERKSVTILPAISFDFSLLVAFAPSKKSKRII